ncbi:doublesex- and mab-3-related transcription factor B1 isoform X1 [Microcaecilia unicolor]|uniref:Doublesex- and mab-3-related transcription factor B1 isoform X1 n=1 Tax=Microcaecilia unicolor TaxID=1415580 RepID=A0A6P7YGV5_9AMPH|nr:doublesex- and mab-3-related transcription factor B1 isoform X1 [Microcaecilia unicolor]
MERAPSIEAAKNGEKMLRTPKCSRCRNHGFVVPVKGHAGKCRWKQCRCDKCNLISERQKIMAAQKALKKQLQEEQEQRPPSRCQAGGVGVSPPGESEEPCCAPPPPVTVARPVPLNAAAVVVSESARASSSLLCGSAPGLAPSMPCAQQEGSAGVVRECCAARCGQGGLISYRKVLQAASHPFPELGHSVLPQECIINPDYLEREPPKVYPAYSSMYHYQPFPVSFAVSQQTYRGPATSSGIVFHRSGRPLHSNQGALQDASGDFRQSYCPPLPQFIPSSFLRGIPCIPPPIPLNVGVLAETTKEVPASATESQDLGVMCERSQPPSQEQTN